MAERPRHEVAEIFHRYLEAQRPASTPRGPRSWSWEQRRVVDQVLACRTARLGGHVDECDACGHRQISYNSCRNRHCPKCQGSAQAGWLDARQAEVLPVPYAHVVFTLPQSLAPLALQSPKVVYDLLFHTVARTLQEIAANPRPSCSKTQPRSGRLPFVVIQESTQSRVAGNGSRARLRLSLDQLVAESLVAPLPMVMLHVLRHGPSKVPLSQ